ncbi:MAG: SAM-dependent chlorinase/fluorinase [candidate division WOR-3 bacterium]
MKVGVSGALAPDDVLSIITFLSDFGEQDWFVAAVKGEILKINPRLRIIDITHCLPSFDIHSAAFLLKSVYKNFPEGTVHLAVVDPGVGSKRKPIIVESDGYYFVGPDNGIFSYIYNDRSKVYEIDIKKKLSSTFHARDIFGPIAARLSNGERPSNLGRLIKGYTKFGFPKIKRKKNIIHGEIVYIDHFGNLITNIPNNMEIDYFILPPRRVKTLIKVKKFYGAGKSGELIAVKGSSGYYEIASNKKSAREILGAKRGMVIYGGLKRFLHYLNHRT